MNLRPNFNLARELLEHNEGTAEPKDPTRMDSESQQPLWSNHQENPKKQTLRGPSEKQRTEKARATEATSSQERLKYLLPWNDNRRQVDAALLAADYASIVYYEDQWPTVGDPSPLVFKRVPGRSGDYAIFSRFNDGEETVCVFAWRGTSGSPQMFGNFDKSLSSMQRYGAKDNTGKVHRGFYIGYAQFEDDFFNFYESFCIGHRVILTGHSRGGAIASIAGIVLTDYIQRQMYSDPYLKRNPERATVTVEQDKTAMPDEANSKDGKVTARERSEKKEMATRTYADTRIRVLTFGEPRGLPQVHQAFTADDLFKKLELGGLIEKHRFFHSEDWITCQFGTVKADGITPAFTHWGIPYKVETEEDGGYHVDARGLTRDSCGSAGIKLTLVTMSAAHHRMEGVYRTAIVETIAEFL